MSDGVLIEREGRLEFYPGLLRRGYVVPSRKPVSSFRFGRLLMFPIGLAVLLLIRPRSPWTAAMVLGTVTAVVDLLRRLPLRGLPKTESPLPVDVWRRESTVQESPVYLGVLFVSTAGAAAGAVALMLTTRRAPAILVAGCVVFGIGAVFMARQWRDHRRAVRAPH